MTDRKQLNRRQRAKVQNQYQILDTIRIHGAISRIEISEFTGQSRASVTNITADLVKKGLIYEKDAEESTSRGRKRVRLTLNPDAVYVAGIKLSSSRISCAITDMKANVRSSIVIPVNISSRSVEFVSSIIEDAVRHCVADSGLRMSDIFGIGIGIPGFIDRDTMYCYWTPLYQRGEISLKDLVEQKLGLKAFLENDANSVTLSHLWFGEGSGVDNFIVVTIEDGIGMGIVINGKLFRGCTGIGSEFGHMVIYPGGALCRCGKNGCIEAYANDSAIVDAAKKSLSEGKWTLPDEKLPITNDNLTILALAGNSTLKTIYAKAGESIGLGLSSLIQIFNPEKIIFSGDGVKAGSILFEPMNKIIAENTNREHLEPVTFVVEKWKDTDWARGASTVALQEFYRFPL